MFDVLVVAYAASGLLFGRTAPEPIVSEGPSATAEPHVPPSDSCKTGHLLSARVGKKYPFSIS